ncbi:MAG: MFS transporter [Candidatus Bathyarchaeota archaeon]|nr:MFS transporter [Candidatus Bathyarchaeota archaeon]
MTIFIDITGFGIVIPLLPFYAQTFQAGSAALGILVASFAMMQFVFAPLLGRVSDMIGRKPVLMISILISSISFMLFAFANSFFLLLLSRIVAGMATETAVAQAYIADITAEDERAKGIGRLGAAFGVGFIVGPAIGGVLSLQGYQAPGIAAVFLTFLNFLFVFLFLPESVTRMKRPKGLPKAQLEGKLSRFASVFAKPLVGPTFLISFIITFAFATIPVIAPLLGAFFFGFGAVELSYVFIYIGVVQIVLQGFLVGKIAKRLGEEKMIVLGPLLMTSGMLVMPLFPSVLLFVGSITLLSIGTGIMDTAIPSFISKRTAKSEQGSMLGVSQSVSSIARVPGPLIGGVVFELAGVVAPFLLSSALLIAAFALGCKVFHACARINFRN